ncbi:uncharacterized protein LOC144440174 [Glandiceps talaboti]
MDECESVTLATTTFFVLLVMSPVCLGVSVVECCWNGGLFDNLMNTCVCPDSNWGSYCQFKGNCTTQCKNDGVCATTVTGQQYCNCSTGYQGDLCEDTYLVNFPSQETVTMMSKCGIIVTSSAPSGGKKSNLGILMLYLIIFILIVAFTILTIHFKREFKSIRKQERAALRRQLDRRHDSFQLGDMYEEADSPPMNEIHVITPMQANYKIGETPTYWEHPPPYHTVVDCVILEEDEDEVEDETRDEQEPNR